MRLTFSGRLVAAQPAAVAAGEPAGPIPVHAPIAVPWDTPAPLNSWGDVVEFAPGSLPVDDPAAVKLLLDHELVPFGYGVEFTDTGAGLAARFEVPREELDTPEVARAVRQMGNGVRDAISVGVIPLEEQVDPLDPADRSIFAPVKVRVLRARLVEVSSVVIPRFDEARHERVAAAAGDPGRYAALEDPATRAGFLATITAGIAGGDDDPTVVDPPTTDDDDQVDVDPPEEDTVTDAATVDDVDRLAAHLAAAGGRTPPRARFSGLGDFAMAVRRGEVDDATRDRIIAALSDQKTTDVPGLLPEAWVGDVVDILGSSSVTVQAFSQRPLPASGLTVNIPVVKQYPDAGQVVGEKVDIPSRPVKIDPESLAVKTYAGGQDISIQTLERTDPGYLNILMGLFAKEMAVQLETDVSASVLAAATAIGTWPAAVKDFNALFIAACADVLGTILTFPDVCVLGLHAWVALGSAVDTDGRPLFPGLSPMNPVGSFQVTDASGQIRGMNYVVAPLMARDSLVVGVREAFVTMPGAIGTLSADVPGVLGRDVAVYRFAAFGATDPRGLRKITGAPAPVAP